MQRPDVAVPRTQQIVEGGNEPLPPIGGAAHDGLALTSIDVASISGYVVTVGRECAGGDIRADLPTQLGSCYPMIP